MIKKRRNCTISSGMRLLKKVEALAPVDMGSRQVPALQVVLSTLEAAPVDIRNSIIPAKIWMIFLTAFSDREKALAVSTSVAQIRKKTSLEAEDVQGAAEKVKMSWQRWMLLLRRLHLVRIK